MKKSKIAKRILVMLAVMSMVFPNLAEAGTQVAKAATAKEAPIFKETKFRRILVGESCDFDISNAPSDATFQWKSNNKAVATVSNQGVVKAVASGSTFITCKITSKTDSIVLRAKVFVKEPSNKPATKVKINNKIQSMAVGETYNLNCTYTPSKASEFVNWTSSDPSVACVNAYGVVTTLNQGTVTIKASTIHNSLTDKVTIKVSPSVKVSTQQELNQALKAGKASTIMISSRDNMELIIKKGDFNGQELIVYAPNAAVQNHGVFKNITIRALNDHGWNEFAKGNTLQVGASSHITVEESADCAIIVDQSNIQMGLTIDGMAKIDALRPCEISCDGTAINLPQLSIESNGVKILTQIPLQINASHKAVIQPDNEEAAKSEITVNDAKFIPKVEGDYKISVTVNDKVQTIGKDTATVSIPSPTTGTQGGTPYSPAEPTLTPPIATSVPTPASPTPVSATSTPVPTIAIATPVPTSVVEVNTKVDDQGFTSDGRIVANFGTPVIDGDMRDEVWNKAILIQPPHTNKAAVKATATFKVLWDDNALYFLAQVKDPDMSVAPGNAYEQDSFEIFLDENNDKTSAYGSDDLHFRVNYNNVQTYDKGTGNRFYTATKIVEQGYMVEGRIELQNPAKNNSIYGIELQINDCIGTSRAGTITVFDTTDGAWNNTALFGEIVLTGKEPGDVPGMNPYKLMALLESAKNVDETGFVKGVGAFTKRVEAAQAIIATPTTQSEMDAAYLALNDVMTFMDLVSKYASMNLDAFTNGQEVKKAVAVAEEIIAKTDATSDEMKQASDALDAAIAGIGSYSLKDVYEDEFYLGAAVHLNGLADETYTKNLLSQYNSITAENDMKPEVLLDQAASQAAGELRCNFTQMDQYCDYAVEHGLKMRGHTFVWHSQTPTWFFREGFLADGDYVDAATMNSRLQQFMNQVFGHIKEKYPDLFYAYDVCNEVVSSMSMGSSDWKKVYGDYSFVTKAFEYARNASEGTGIKLYYNDYNCYDEGKAEKILDLIADAKKAGNIDGIGMQSHVNIVFPPMDQYRATIAKFVAAGFDVQITELDIATAIDGNGPAPDATMAAKQAQMYKELFQCYLDYKDNISSVTLWGINDQHSWRGSQEPLIYDRDYNEKDSYWNIISVGLADK